VSFFYAKKQKGGDISLKTIMDEAAMQRAITRITYEILERNHGAEQIALIGIYSRGAILAERIAEKINAMEHRCVELGALDITIYRDDRIVTNHAEKTKIDFPVQDKKVILVDDVIYTGRSCRAAMDAVLARGRPTSIQLAVLIDRGHRELPIRPDYVGKNLPTAQSEKVKVSVRELDHVDCVSIF
jgi:pyrimidine operon attenuation protein/uracil phosphoribosyltransferase